MSRYVSVLVALSLTAAGQTNEPQVRATSGQEKSFWQKLQYTALVDGFGGAHFQNSAPTALRVFDTNGRSLQFSYIKAGLWLDAEPVGFRLDVGYGQTIDVLSADTSTPVLRQVEQGYLSGKIPLHRGVTIDVGRFLTCAGNETVDSRQSWLYSRSLIFGYAAPFTHTGIRVTAPLTDTLTLLLGATQGWDVILDNNNAKSFFVSASYTPSRTQTLALSVFAGPELTADDQTWRLLVDGVWVGKLPHNIDMALNFDAAVEGQTAWYGAALSGHYTIERFDFAVRLEAFNDPQNVRLKLAQAPNRGSTAWEFSANVRATLNQYFQMRAEYRHDQLIGAASIPQDTLTFAMVAGL